jgi:alpha-L-fucosidase
MKLPSLAPAFLVATPFALAATGPAPAINPGPFEPTLESFARYECPDWFRDAKFGIWSHWGPQAVPRQGDWYAKRLYQGPFIDSKTGEIKSGDSAYHFHVKNYGHPSKVGFKDIIPLWKAERWEPEQLMALFKKTGAKYFVSMGSHHDNFFLWNSRIHRWNSVQMGPKKDVVGLWQEAAKKEGLRFGVSEHLAASFTWYQPSHGADLDGPLKGVPYDGNNLENQDLYQKPAAPGDTDWLTTNPDFHQLWFRQVTELIDLYQPDLLYSDSALPFDGVGRSMLAHYYNQDAARNGGRAGVVYNCKQEGNGKWVRDIERGVAEGVSPQPWQTDTSIGDWYYRTGQKYMSAGEVVRMLTDIVSKNGNLLLNVVQTPEGDLEPDVLHILDGIGAWIAINGEAIYATRPWVVYGEGPSTSQAQEKGHWGGLRDVPTKPYSAEDYRFTTSKDGATLYAFCFGTPDSDFRVLSLGSSAGKTTRVVSAVSILGCSEPLKWTQTSDALVVTKPSSLKSSEATVLKISFKS